jgi:Ion channel
LPGCSPGCAWCGQSCQPSRTDHRARLDRRLIEGWSVHESIYFAFVSGLTIGYGDLAPKSLLTRALAIFIGVCGVLLTALVAAIAVFSLGRRC